MEKLVYSRFTLVHAMGHSKVILQNGLSLVVFSTVYTRIKRRFSVGSLYVPIQTCWMEDFSQYEHFTFPPGIIVLVKLQSWHFCKIPWEVL